MPGFEEISKLITEKWELLAAIVVILSPIVGGCFLLVRKWLRTRQQQQRQKKIPSGDFPFEVIPPQTDKLLQQLMPGGEETDPLADFNIPYLQRQPNRNIRQELERAFEEKPWIVILGQTGLGKTREAAHLAELLNGEGWTVLKLAERAGEWLDEPRQFPIEKISPNAKLLFFLDNLNRWLYRGNPREIPVNADNPAQPLRVSVQERLLRTLDFFVREGCEVRVIATARNEPDRHTDHPSEPSELEKLRFEKYPEFWERFYLYELVEPSDKTIVQLLEDRVGAATLKAKPEEYERIAKKNDRTFRNIIETLITAKNRDLQVSLAELSESLDGTWRKRYKAAIKRFPTARYIYDAIEVLQQLNLSLSREMVMATSVMLLPRQNLKRFWQWWQLRQALRYLIQTERILRPRDGQVEAKREQVDIRQYIPQVLKQLSQVGAKHYSQDALASEFFDCGLALGKFERYEEAITSWDEALRHKPDFHEAWYIRGLALGKFERYEEAITSLDEVVRYKPDFYEAWYIRGLVLGKLERYEEAITSFSEAMRHKSDFHEAWNDRGVALSNLGRYEEAVAGYDEALRIEPNSSGAIYNKACYYGLKGKMDEAIEHLKQAIDLNSEVREWVKTDSDFDSIRNDDRFQALINSDENQNE